MEKTKIQIIMDDIICKIKSGELRPGDDLPMNRDMQKTYNCGRWTVWDAKNRLERRGIIDPGSGRGGPGAYGRHTTVSLLAPYLL